MPVVPLKTLFRAVTIQGVCFWSTYVLLVRGPSSQADKSRGLLRQPSPIRHWAVVFPLCPYSADKRPDSGVCQTNCACCHVAFSFAIQCGLNYWIFCLGPLDVVEHTPQCVVGMHTPPVIAVGTTNKSLRALADWCFQLLPLLHSF